MDTRLAYHDGHHICISSPTQKRPAVAIAASFSPSVVIVHISMISSRVQVEPAQAVVGLGQACFASTSFVPRQESQSAWLSINHDVKGRCVDHSERPDVPVALNSNILAARPVGDAVRGVPGLILVNVVAFCWT